MSSWAHVSCAALRCSLKKAVARALFPIYFVMGRGREGSYCLFAFLVLHSHWLIKLLWDTASHMQSSFACAWLLSVPFGRLPCSMMLQPFADITKLLCCNTIILQEYVHLCDCVGGPNWVPITRSFLSLEEDLFQFLMTCFCVSEFVYLFFLFHFRTLTCKWK